MNNQPLRLDDHLIGNEEGVFYEDCAYEPTFSQEEIRELKAIVDEIVEDKK